MRIVLEVDGGIVRLSRHESGPLPDNFEIIVRDYDIDGIHPDSLKTDDRGIAYFPQNPLPPYLTEV